MTKAETVTLLITAPGEKPLLVNGILGTPEEVAQLLEETISYTVVLHNVDGMMCILGVELIRRSAITIAREGGGGEENASTHQEPMANA